VLLEFNFHRNAHDVKIQEKIREKEFELYMRRKEMGEVNEKIDDYKRVLWFGVY
jgi:hypothetical protein